MRHISGLPTLIFLLILSLATGLGGIMGHLVFALVSPSPFAALGSVAAFVLFFYLALLAIYRLWMLFRPIPEGPIALGSPAELSYFVSILFWLLFFNFFTGPCWVPVPLTRQMYKLFGAKIGPRSYFGGTIFDPHFVEIGSDSMIGAHAKLIPHFQQGKRLEHYKIKLGNNVTVGAMSIVMAGCELADGAILGAQSLLPKGTKIGANEVWAGNPAKFIRLRSPDDL